jgi:4'-phosphopantetheinyl transferase EntD
MPDLAARLHAILPAHVAVASADPAARHPDIGPPNAVPHRRAEFAAGRAAATIAMQALGYPATPIPIGPDRAPQWPFGISGSITHTRTCALAAVTRAPALIGIDLEPDDAVIPPMWDAVFLLSERALIDAAPDPVRMATLIFCAKEATYKAQYPLTHLLFGFDRIEIIPGTETFTATFRAATGPIRHGTIWTGHHAHAQGHILTALLRSSADG